MNGQPEALHTVTVHGVRLHYAVTGEGRPIVLVHGNGEDHTIFATETAQLAAAGYRVYAPDFTPDKLAGFAPCVIAQAEQGEHDDLVMALGIAHAIRGQQRAAAETPATEGRAVWTADMWDDYNRASAEEREFLIRLWGEPKR